MRHGRVQLSELTGTDRLSVEDSPPVCKPPQERKAIMNEDFLWLGGAVVLWIVLNKWILPKLGFRT